MSNHVTMLSMLETERGIQGCHLFAYSSKALPSLEIIGMGRRGKMLKEKIIYWLKRKNVRLLPLKYVVCLEHDLLPTTDDEDNFRWLELPSLLLVLQLAEQLQLSSPHRCFCAGKLALNGEWIFPEEIKDEKNLAEFLVKYGDTVLMNEKLFSNFFGRDHFKRIDLTELMEDVGNIYRK